MHIKHWTWYWIQTDSIWHGVVFTSIWAPAVAELGECYNFDGSDDYVETPLSMWYYSGTLSIKWYFKTTTTSWGYIADMRDSVGDGIYLKMNANWTISWEANSWWQASTTTAYNDWSRHSFELKYVQDSDLYVIIDSATPVYWQTYVDPYETVNVTNNIRYWADFNWANAFQGKMYNLEVYKGSSLLLYECHETSWTTAIDSTANGNDWTIYNATPATFFADDDDI